MRRAGVLGLIMMLAAAPLSQAFAQTSNGTTVSNGTVYNAQGDIIGTVGADGTVTSASGLPIGLIAGGVFVALAVGLGVAELTGKSSSQDLVCVQVVSGVQSCN